jgi:hypothetical protein
MSDGVGDDYDRSLKDIVAATGSQIRRGEAAIL